MRKGEIIVEVYQRLHKVNVKRAEVRTWRQLSDGTGSWVEETHDATITAAMWEALKETVA